MLVYKIPDEYVEFMSTIVGKHGSILNMRVKDADGNTIIGQEEFNMEEFAEFKKEYETEITNFVLITYKPKQYDEIPTYP